MKTRNLAFLAAVASLTACGLKSESNRFGLDGIGDPRPPDGNIIPGKFHGTFESTRWVTKDPRVTPLIGTDFSALQGLFSSNPIEGLGGLGLLVISTTPPPRATGPENCYEDLGISPELGGSLQFVDVGQSMTFTVAPGTGPSTKQAVNRAADATLSSPQTDQLVYVSNFNQQASFAYDFAQTVTWGGGTLDTKGFIVAPARTDTTPVVTFPAELTGPNGAPNPTVNGLDLFSANANGVATDLPNAQQYRIKWQPAPASADMGVQIVVQVYGPINLPSATNPNKPAVNDIPYFNKLGQIVCLAKESDGTGGFLLDRGVVDALVEHIKQTSAYEKSTEDVNHSGALEAGEDANFNHRIDKIYGAVLILNRRTENAFPACLSGTTADCSATVPVFISGNATKLNHTKWVLAQ